MFTLRSTDPDVLSEFGRDELRRLRKKNVELRTHKEILKGGRVSRIEWQASHATCSMSPTDEPQDHPHIMR